MPVDIDLRRRDRAGYAAVQHAVREIGTIIGQRGLAGAQQGQEHKRAEYDPRACKSCFSVMPHP